MNKGKDITKEVFEYIDNPRRTAKTRVKRRNVELTHRWAIKRLFKYFIKNPKTTMAFMGGGLYGEVNFLKYLWYYIRSKFEVRMQFNFNYWSDRRWNGSKWEAQHLYLPIRKLSLFDKGKLNVWYKLKS